MGVAIFHLPNLFFVLTPEFLSLYNTYKLQTERRSLSDLSISSAVHPIIIIFCSFINFSVENMEYVVESYWEKRFFFSFFHHNIM